MKYTLARFTVKPEHLQDTRRALAGLLAEVREHQPRTLYTVFRTDTPETFVALMCFENEAAELRHSQSKYIAQFARKILPWCDGKPLFRELAIFGSTHRQWLLETEPFAADQLLALPAKAKAKRAARPKQVALKKLGRRPARPAARPAAAP